MKRRWIVLFSVLVILFLFSACNGENAIGTAGVQSAWPDNATAPNLVEQFRSIDPHGGRPLAFAYSRDGGEYVGVDPWECKHYQGIERIDGEDGVYFYLTRSGNKTGGCPTQGNDPGELLIVRMDSMKDRVSKPLGSNRGSSGKDAPPAKDDTVTSILFDGTHGWPAWMHLGSGQRVGDIMAIPLENPYPDGGDHGAIIFIDISNPAQPEPIKVIRKQYVCQENGDCITSSPMSKMGSIGMTRLDDGTLLLAVSGGDFEPDAAVLFLKSSTPDVTSDDFRLEILSYWNSNKLLPDKNDHMWSCGRDCSYAGDYEFQTLQFVKRNDGQLFLIGMDNDTMLTNGGQDLARIFKVERDGLEFTLTFVDELHLYLSDPVNMGDMDAASGVFVTPGGRLIIYTADHDNEGPKVNDRGVLEFGEFVAEPLN